MVTQYSAKVDLDITNPNGPVSDFEDSIYKLTANQDDLPVKEKIIEDEITIYDLRKRDATQQEAFLGQSSFRYSSQMIISRSRLKKNKSLLDILFTEQ